MKKSNLKWAVIQPLTGGVYFAAEQSFGKSAEWILSYPGLEKEYFNKDGKCINMGNERHLLKYLEKNNNLPPYTQFDHDMFDDRNGKIIHIKNNEEYGNKKFKEDDIIKNEIDLICAVPVCSGLSAANTQDHGKKDSIKNNNMKFITEFTLTSIQPKVFIFENAPNLFTNVGIEVRDYLNNVALDRGYSVSYIKTDTRLHKNVQKRIRTFVIFWKWLDNKPTPPPMIGYENAPFDTVQEYLNLIPKNATQQDIILNEVNKDREYNFIKKHFGKNWRKEVGRQRLKSFIISRGLENDFYQFHKDDKLKAHYKYCKHKLDIQKGYFDRSHFVMGNDYMPTVYHGNTWSAIHPTEDRCLNFREYIHAMGLPHDFEYLHNKHTFGSVIGQNVPVNTFKFWIDECRYIIEDWDNRRKKAPIGVNRTNVYFHDNIHQRGEYK